MQHLILEAARRKDEDIDKAGMAADLEEVEALESDPGTFIQGLKNKIEANLGPGCGLEDIYQDDSWDRLVIQLSRTGEDLNLGKLTLGYIDKGETNDYIVMPGEKTTVISVNPKCPRDKLLQLLSD
jgi:hypothetical protein